MSSIGNDKNKVRGGFDDPGSWEDDSEREEANCGLAAPVGGGLGKYRKSIHGWTVYGQVSGGRFRLTDMTNLLCAVIVTLLTNWTTVSRTVPVLGNPLWAVHRDVMLNQVGQRVTNYVAIVAWKGKTNEVVFESIPDATGERLERSVPEPNGGAGGIFVNPAVLSDNPVIRFQPYQPVIHWEVDANGVPQKHAGPWPMPN